jgi:hypothetical protein
MKYKNLNIEGVKNIGKTTTCIVLRKTIKDMNKELIIKDNLGFGELLANKLADGELLKDLEFTQAALINEYQEMDVLTLFLLPSKIYCPKRVIMTPDEINKQKYMELIPHFLFNKKLNFATLYIEEGEKILEIVNQILKIVEKK